jgi:hypothetical protein
MKVRTITIHVFMIIASCSSGNKKASSSEPEFSPVDKGRPAKIVLKAWNNQYVSLDPGTMALTANQPDIANAEPFEIVKLANDKSALMTSNGKFISDNQNRNDSVLANRDNVSFGEKFEIISVDDSGITLKSSSGKFVSSDLHMGGLLIANRNEARDWEKFKFEFK